MNKFLVATDLSPRSDRAFNRALALSDEWKASLTILHVVDEDLPSPISNQLKAAAETSIGNQLDAFPTLDRKSIASKVVLGSGFKDILREADDSNVDLIIMGMHRDESLGDLFRGTTVERVVRRGNHPVLVVRGKTRRPYRRVMVGVDFSVYSRRALEFALKFVPQGEVIIVHAYDVPFRGILAGTSGRGSMTKEDKMHMDGMLAEEMQALVASLTSPPPNLKQVVREGSARDVIPDQVKKLRPDLLVVGTHGRTGVAHAVLGSVAGNLIDNPPCDVLAVKAW